jgi:hypothetical protein
MAKSQKRSNREQKKPKQAKKAAAPGGAFAVTQAKPAAPVPGKRK